MVNCIKFIYITIFIILNSYSIYGQINPKNNSKINYTQVMFEYPEIKKALYYIIQIAINSEPKLFEKNIVIEQVDSTAATLINGLKFGTSYQWRYIAFDKEGNIINISNRYFFNILKNNLVDENYNKYRINTKIVDDGLIFLDGSRVAINRAGEPVWFMPNNVIDARDIKMTKSGTITYISNDAFEISIEGDILWKTNQTGLVSGDYSEGEYFHHEFQKLGNGNYLLIGNKFETPKININKKSIVFGTLIEYNRNNDIVWSYNCKNLVSDTDVYFSPNNRKDINFSNYSVKEAYDPLHVNAFYFDEDRDILYISLRLFSRIVKMSKKTGNVLANYGEKFPSGDAKYANNFFRYQHSPILLSDGYLAVFNNNNLANNNDSLFTSSVVIFSQPNEGQDKSEKKWEFLCNFDSLYPPYSLGQGNIFNLKDSSFIVNMGSPGGRIFEVTRNKDVVWDCLAQKYIQENNRWEPSCSYRVSYTSSLYPVYFTLNNSYNSSTISYKKDFHIFFKINNEGSSSDKYAIKYNLNNSCKIINSDEVLPNKSIGINIELQKGNIKNKEITITVSSFVNTEFKKELKFYIE